MSRRLQAEGLACQRDDRLLFQNLHFTLQGGEALQVEGRNGSGKTSLLRILCGLSQPSEGAVLWCGGDIRSNQPDYFGELCYVGHHLGVKDDLTPIENLEFTGRLGRPRADANPEQALDWLGLPDQCFDLPCRKLSAGQRRRVALARLLLTDSAVWVLDEPFTALDVKGRGMVEGMLSSHLASGGMAIMTTHHVMDLGDSRVHRLHIGS